MRYFIVSLLCPLLPLAAQEPIRYLPQQKVFVLKGGSSTYAFGINGRNELQHIYWGARLHRDADLASPREERGWASFDLSPTTTPDEYPAWGAGRFIETCLKPTRADGVRDIVLKCASHQIKGDTLEILTSDLNDDIRATLAYRVYSEAVIERKAIITNSMNQPLTLESAQSAAWNLPHGEGYRLSYLTGR